MSEQVFPRMKATRFGGCDWVIPMAVFVAVRRVVDPSRTLAEEGWEVSLIKLWWHCLAHLFPLKGDHRMITEGIYNEAFDSYCVERRYCACGYEP